MKAVGYRANWPVDHAEALLDVELPAPVPGARDVLVRVKAVSVNPVDTKVRKGSQPPEGQVKVLGWDAVGTVEAVGAQVSRFKVGDRVYYAGSITRPGANSELHAVDERIVALAPQSLSDEQAAALPLTTITAYELLFDRLSVAKGGGAGQTLLVVGGAGSLFVAPGVQLVDTPQFPAEWKQGALAAREALNWIRTENTLDWTFLSPPILLQPGERTGQYRLGDEAPLMNGDQPGSISEADLAVAMVDELETPRHVQKRFTVAN